MADLLCLIQQTDGSVQVTTVPDVLSCVGGYVAVASTDYVSLSTLGTLFETYFAFDITVFEIITGGLLLAFAAGHGLGRMMQAWRKTL